MLQNKISILFFIRRDRINKKNQAPVLGGITYKSKRHVFSTGLFVKPEKWDAKAQQSSDKKDNYLNMSLQIAKQKLEQIHLELFIKGKPFTAEDIYLAFSGKDKEQNEKTLLEVFQQHNNKLKTLLNIDYSLATIRKYIMVYNQLKDFIRWKYGKNDILLSELKLTFLSEFDYYLKTQMHQKQITINKSIQRVRTIIKIACGEGYLNRDPFILYKPKKVTLNPIFLTAEELELMKNYDFGSKRLNQVRDCYILCCYTGLPYLEMATLRTENIVTGFDGNLWISIWRVKTDKELAIPLLPQAREIIDKYTDKERDTLLPIISNQKFNTYLKEITNKLKINKKITHHTARKTFASTVLLYNDVPIEVVSELLGHSKIVVTQEHYGRVVKKKVSQTMIDLMKKMQ